MEKSRNLNIYISKLQQARIELMRTNPFYAVLLMKTSFGLDDYAVTAYTNGDMIAFNPDFLFSLSNDEVQFVLMHEVLHIALNHCNRNIEGIDPYLYNIACDIVVNSNILYSFNMDTKRITLKKYGESIHKTPSGKEGYLFTIEQVLEMIIKEDFLKQKSKKEKNKANGLDRFDDHSFWKNDDDKDKEEERKQNVVNAKKIRDKISKTLNKQAGKVSQMLLREIDKYINAQTDWKEVLQNFIQNDNVDYSFNPPDRRFQDNEFILPDLTEKDEKISNIWFCVDTSASISDTELKQSLSEIKGAIDQFDGKLEGYLSYFDASISEPQSFSTFEELKKIRPVGGGGTSFDVIFNSLSIFFKDELPSYIIILTDGKAPYPEETVNKGIPVLWLINNDYETPPRGRVARINTNE